MVFQGQATFHFILCAIVKGIAKLSMQKFQEKILNHFQETEKTT